MASLRGSQKLWAGATVNQNDTSSVGFVGTNTNVVLFIRNSGGINATFKVQVAAPDAPSAGRNADPTNWYDLAGQTAVAVNAGASTAINLSPFAPPYLRLVRTDALAATTVDASVAGIPDD